MSEARRSFVHVGLPFLVRIFFSSTAVLMYKVARDSLFFSIAAAVVATEHVAYTHAHDGDALRVRREFSSVGGVRFFSCGSPVPSSTLPRTATCTVNLPEPAPSFVCVGIEVV